MDYMVLTSDGVVHETNDAEQYVAWLDQYGPEVVDQHEPPEAWQETNQAMLRTLRTPNRRRNIGSIHP